MVVGVLRLTLHIPEAHSLKERRMVVRRVVERVRARFNVSVAEVGDLERWQVATVAATAVSNDRRLVNEVLDRVASQAASACAGTAVVTHRQMEMLSFGDGEALRDEGLRGALKARREGRGAGDDFDFEAWASGNAPPLAGASAAVNSEGDAASARALVDDEDDDDG